MAVESTNHRGYGHAELKTRVMLYELKGGPGRKIFLGSPSRLERSPTHTKMLPGSWVSCQYWAEGGLTQVTSP